MQDASALPGQSSATVSDLPLGKRLREFLTVAFIAAALLGLLYLRTDRMTESHPVFAQPWDHHKYIHMAQTNPVGFHIAPFCWRILHPALAKALPFSLDTNFLLATLLELFLTGVLTYYMLKAWGFSQIFALTGMLFFFSLPAATKDSIFAFWDTDQLARLFVVAGICLLLIRRPLWSSLVFAAGIAAKESVLVAVPLYYTLFAEKLLDRQRLWRAFLFALPALAVFLALRTFIPAWNSNPAYVNSIPFNLSQCYNGQASFHYTDLLVSIVKQKLRDFSGWELKALSVSTFGLLCILPLFAWRKNLPLLARFAVFLLLTYFTMLFSSSFERVLIIAFPAMLILSLNGMEALRLQADAPEGVCLLLPLLLFPIGLLRRTAINPFFEAEALVFILFLAFLFQWRQFRRSRQPYEQNRHAILGA